MKKIFSITMIVLLTGCGHSNLQEINRLNQEIESKDAIIMRYERFVDSLDELPDTIKKSTLDSLFGVYIMNQ